ncbi:MAG TPA: hypothetical protein VEI06_10765 [Gemmatimonadaceae bacterium]|nr:hypothetical protein [Gemmatimonadaceae bacterium]
MPKAHSPGDTSGSALDSLLAIEREIASRLATAQRDAEALVAETREESARAAADAAKALERELRRLGESREAHRAELIASLEAEMALRTARWQALDGPSVARLGSKLAASIIATGEDEP